MNNISFRAKLEGMNSPDILNCVFEIKTQKDTKHKLQFIKREAQLEYDKFELYTNGKKTAEYETNVEDEQKFPIQRLIEIFNILKVKEAQNKVNSIKKSK